MVREKTMRSDFYYRVNVLSITLPPLRDRPGDIALLVEAWLEKRGLSLVLPPHVRLAVEQYDWPGNVRELHNFLDRYLAFGDEALMSLGDAGRADLLLNTPQGISLEQAVLQLEERMIKQTLERCRWHRGKAAEELGLNLIAGNSHALEILENGIPLAWALRLQIPELDIHIFRERMVSLPLDHCGCTHIENYGETMARNYLPKPKTE